MRPTENWGLYYVIFCIYICIYIYIHIRMRRSCGRSFMSCTCRRRVSPTLSIGLLVLTKVSDRPFNIDGVWVRVALCWSEYKGMDFNVILLMLKMRCLLRHVALESRLRPKFRDHYTGFSTLGPILHKVELSNDTKWNYQTTWLVLLYSRVTKE